MTTPSDVLGWWIDEVGPEGWYKGGEEMDEAVRARFATAYEELVEGAYGLWLTGAFGTLAYLIMVDQFPRNLFRGQSRAFATDALARAVAKAAIDKNWDRKVPEPERQFFYLPLMHSENLPDQDRCVRLFATRMPQSGPENLLHARAHRAVIRRFGRFPFRNEALGRATTPAEAAWLAETGYGGELRALREAAASEGAG